ncbi:MAG TPA: xanthine dehydrogenase family protein molybdopterin-binding subunit [Pyrinomonadaceae bacterium]|nr:xanthine dehydrogenase family protein molybdopterin-binding subunit [Pyrinomonadaceae bacterium]
MKDRLVGRPVPRKEGRAKVTGAALYVDDLAPPGLLHGVTVRSRVPRGRIREVAFDPSLPWDEFTVVTARDIPGENAVALILLDQPYLADGSINHPEEPILLLAHEDKHLLEEARRAVRVEVEPLPAVFTIEESLAGGEVIWGEDNVFKSFLVEKGDADGAGAGEDLIVVEGEYRTGAQEQLYIEPNGCLATADPERGVVVQGSMQCPYYVHKALVKLFGLPPERVRVIQTETGGGFGGKEEYPSMIAGHAALLAWKSGRPVKMVYDRAEDMAATTKRHPSRTRHRTRVTRDGRLVSMEIDFDIDGGAYATLSSVVLSRGTIHAAGPYHCPNVRVRSRAVATNAPPHGAFRGFGAPQSIFALERHLDKVARAVGLAPEELRRRNFIRQGDTTATGQVIREAVDVGALLERAFELSDYRAKRERFARENPSAKVKRGIGFATFMHGAGFTGSGEKFLQSQVGVEATAEGRVRVLAASTEIGQGTNTIFAQIAAEALGLDYDEVEVVRPDTADVPDSGPTVASRTCMIVGKLVETSALGVRAVLKDGGLLGDSYRPEEFRRACREYAERHGALRVFTRYEQPADVNWDDQLYRGDAYSAFAWAAYVAEVSVDAVTFEARVEDFVAVQEVGRVIHPVLAAGQIEGGVAQGVGWALYERVAWREGRMANGQMTNYIIPTSADMPPVRVHFVENPFPGGPGGAKGIGELPMDGPAPAIAGALEQATGVAFDHVPVMPEEIMEAMEERRVDSSQ